jgi:hypothetical protein
VRCRASVFALLVRIDESRTEFVAAITVLGKRLAEICGITFDFG